jgi:hypothetical protein
MCRQCEPSDVQRYDCLWAPKHCKSTHLLSHQKGLSSPDSSLRLLTRKEIFANPNGEAW